MQLHPHTFNFQTAHLMGFQLTLLTSLINRRLVMVEDFGHEIDNPEDYVDEDLKRLSEKISYFEFCFETKMPIDYDSLPEQEADKILYQAIEKSDDIILKTDEKDILIYL
ncbi:hypothetical protein [Flavobacterium anhuiense]|uniref:hypothetical protein n=1 Tax=Flavobacterium anhuiense TaxID=459526 RepID=UPI001F0C2B7C|nr:hypothetical protein [Flavobacterium anhuiense]